MGSSVGTQQVSNQDKLSIFGSPQLIKTVRSQNERQNCSMPILTAEEQNRISTLQSQEALSSLLLKILDVHYDVLWPAGNLGARGPQAAGSSPPSLRIEVPLRGPTPLRMPGPPSCPAAYSPQSELLINNLIYIGKVSFLALSD